MGCTVLLPQNILMAVDRMAPLDYDDLDRTEWFYAVDIGFNPGHAPTQNIVRWLRNVRALDEFVRTHGTPPVKRVGPSATDPLEQHLARWVSRQRTRQVELCSYQDAALSLVPNFSWSPLDDRFDLYLSQLQGFIDAHGHMPAIRSGDAAEHRLGLWVRRQKTRRRAKRLPAERTVALTALPGWVW
jgi:hypothetical protein